jgi:hypothetical protein
MDIDHDTELPPITTLESIQSSPPKPSTSSSSRPIAPRPSRSRKSSSLAHKQKSVNDSPPVVSTSTSTTKTKNAAASAMKISINCKPRSSAPVLTASSTRSEKGKSQIPSQKVQTIVSERSKFFSPHTVSKYAEFLVLSAPYNITNKDTAFVLALATVCLLSKFVFSFQHAI